MLYCGDPCNAHLKRVFGEAVHEGITSLVVLLCCCYALENLLPVERETLEQPLLQDLARVVPGN